MQGVIVHFRRGIKKTHSDQMIVQIDGVDKREEAKAFVGKKVVWVSPAKKELKGEIKGAHGNNGAVRVKWERGMPGQSIGTKVEVLVK